MLHHRLTLFLTGKFTIKAAIGSPLAPVLANIFMGFYKSKWLNEHNLNKSKLYLRYVVDILAAFDNEQDSLNFWNSLNNPLTLNLR